MWLSHTFEGKLYHSKCFLVVKVRATTPYMSHNQSEIRIFNIANCYWVIIYVTCICRENWNHKRELLKLNKCFIWSLILNIRLSYINRQYFMASFSLVNIHSQYSGASPQHTDIFLSVDHGVIPLGVVINRRIFLRVLWYKVPCEMICGD